MQKSIKQISIIFKQIVAVVHAVYLHFYLEQNNLIYN